VVVAQVCYTLCMQRTIVVQLNPDIQQRAVLLRTLQEHTACFNAVTAQGFPAQCSNGVELHKRTYYDLRAQFPDLPAQLVCAARVKATEAVKSALTWAKKVEQAYPRRVAKANKRGWTIPVFKPVRCPHSTITPIRYDQRSSWVKWETMTCSLATVAGRIVLPFTIPASSQWYAGSRSCSADLCYRKGRFTLHIVVEVPAPVVAPDETVVGVDLGLNRPAVTSNRQFLGEKRWKEQERRFFRLRRKLQARGTRSARRHLKRLSGKQLRQRRDHDHVLSKRIVQSTPPGATLVFENLTDIRETRDHGTWQSQQERGTQTQAP
jgi:putative transposase